MNFSPKSIYTWYRQSLRNPQYRGWIILGTLVYLISPIDIAPDIFPFVGQIDDVLILTLFVTEISQIAFEYLGNLRQAATDFDATDTAETATGDNRNQATTIDVDAVSVD